jgi:hypothetical protein
MITPTTYNGFRLKPNDPNDLKLLMKTVDDYYKDLDSNIMQIDAARVALSHIAACSRVKPLSGFQRQFLDGISSFGLRESVALAALTPNRIEQKHFTKSSRVRNLVHGGILGILAVRLLNDSSTRAERTMRTWNSLCIIRRANSESGCDHVKWSIPEFQCRHNMGIKHHKRTKSCFEAMSIDETKAELDAMNTAENRQRFMDDCSALANRANHSRIKHASIVHEDACTRCERQFPLANEWITKYVSAFVKVCSHKMHLVTTVSSLSLIDRAKHLVDLYRFMSSNMDWILMDCNLRFVCKLHTLWPKYLERLVYMSQEGIEHSACILSRYFPEMMTPELHVVVKSKYPYRMPGMQIADDDALFGPLKLACQGLLPDGVCERVVRARRDYESDDEFDRDYGDEEFDRDEVDEDEEDDDYTDDDDDYSDDDDDYESDDAQG